MPRSERDEEAPKCHGHASKEHIEPPFAHTRLEDAAKQTRLLQFVQSGLEENDVIQLQISMWNTDEVAEYVANSYVWGAGNELEMFIINNLLSAVQVNGLHLRVRDNCRKALWQMRIHHADAVYG